MSAIASLEAAVIAEYYNKFNVRMGVNVLQSDAQRAQAALGMIASIENNFGTDVSLSDTKASLALIVSTLGVTATDFVRVKHQAVFLELIPGTKYREQNSAAIEAAIASVSANGGDIYWPSHVSGFGIARPFPLVSGVRHFGHPCKRSYTLDFPDSGTDITGGTYLIGDGTFDAVTGNNVDLGSPKTPFCADMINGAGIDGLAFKGFRNGIVIGAINQAGCVNCNFKNIGFNQTTGWDMIFSNYLFCHFEQIWSSRDIESSGGIYRFRASVASSILICGNSTFNGVYGELASPQTRGIVFDTELHCVQNELNITRMQVNRYWWSSVPPATYAVTLTNGSASIVVPDSTKFPQGMPVNMSAPFWTGHLFFATPVDAHHITVSDTPDGAPVVSPASGAATLTCGGWPNMEFNAIGSNGAITHVTARGLDLEGGGTVGLLLNQCTATEIHICEFGPASQYVWHMHCTSSYNNEVFVQSPSVTNGFVIYDNQAASNLLHTWA